VTSFVMLIIRSESRPDDCRELEGDSLLAAKISAAILYAGMAFTPDAPSAYLILGPTGDVVYRFPER
jgi:hypothetical protein